MSFLVYRIGAQQGSLTADYAGEVKEHWCDALAEYAAHPSLYDGICNVGAGGTPDEDNRLDEYQQEDIRDTDRAYRLSLAATERAHLASVRNYECSWGPTCEFYLTPSQMGERCRYRFDSLDLGYGNEACATVVSLPSIHNAPTLIPSAAVLPIAGAA